MSLAIQASGLTKHYKVGKNNLVKALGPIDLEIPENSFTIVIGRSGSGKSTLLNLLTGLDKPSAGTLIVNGRELSSMNRKQIAKYRSGIGIIFQQYNLLSNLTTTENVLMGSWAGGGKATEREALELLDKFGIAHRAKARVTTLSGGEKQRVAVCRSLISKPNILFCDEPTGALDSKNEENVRDILVGLHSEGMTVVMVTHNLEFEDIGTQIFKLNDGLLEVHHNSYKKSNKIVTRNYDKAEYNNADLWLFKDFLEKKEISDYLTKELPEDDLEINDVKLLGLKSIIGEISEQYPGKKVFPFGFLPIAKDANGGLIVYFRKNDGIYYLDREIFFEDTIKLVRENEELVKTYETQSIVSHAEKVFADLPTFLKAVLTGQK